MKVAVIVLADTETHADLGRIANALEEIKAFHGTGDASLLVSSLDSCRLLLPLHSIVSLCYTC
jgi:hypothetical protein